MKLHLWAFLCATIVAVASASVHAGNSKKSPNKAFSKEVRCHKKAYKLLLAINEAEVNSIDNQTDAIVLDNLIKELTAARKDLIANINATMRAVSADSLEYTTAQIMALRCLKLLKRVQGVNFAELESKLDTLKIPRQAPAPKPTRGRQQGKPAQQKRSSSTPPVMPKPRPVPQKPAFKPSPRPSSPKPTPRPVVIPRVPVQPQNHRPMGQQAESIALPASLAGTAVYHIRAYQINEYCCGYNALWNGLNLEASCGLPNDYSNYEIFNETCRGFLNHKRIDPRVGVNNITLETLGQNYLGMQSVYNLSIIDGAIQSLFLTPVSAQVRYGASQYEIDNALRQKELERGKDLFEAIQYNIDASAADCTIVHFICHIWNVERHGILISLVKNRSGRALYIFDNVNTLITEGSESKRFIDFLCRTFRVSPKNQFRGPQLPYIWKTTPMASRVFDL